MDNPITEEIKAIGQRMATQDNRGTRFPLFVIKHDVKEYVNEWEDDIDGEYEDDDGETVRYKWREEFDLRAGVFFTEESAEKHLKQNHYNYGKNAHVYAIGAWRNPEMQAVMKTLSAMGTEDNSIPPAYK